MLVLYTLLVSLVVVLVLFNIYKANLFSQARRKGKLQTKGKATMFDVRHLLMEGEKDLAIELYCQLFHVSQTKAKKDVEELQRSLKV